MTASKDAKTVGFIDLFCGAGLFSAGFARAGMRPLLALDLDEHAIASYRRNVSDVAVVGCTEDYSLARKADVLLAGPPCQGFSTLGRRDPADTRNRLCMVIPKWAELSEARVVVVENVPPFLQSSHWSTMRDALVGQGFTIEVWVLNAANFGAPQLRLRAFTVASKVGPIGEPTPSTEMIPAAQAFAPVRAGDPMHVWPKPSQLALERFEMIPEFGDKRDVLRAAPDRCPPSWHRLGTKEATDVWGRVDPRRPANTLRCRFQNASTGRYIHPSENRVLSIREGARLQGVSDEWVFEGHRKSIARQVGNGVPVPLAHAVAQRIMETLQKNDL